MVHFRVCFLLRIYFILLLVKLWTNMSHIWHYHTKYVALILWQYCLYTTYFHVDVCSASSFSNTWELCPNLSVFGNDHNFATTLLLSLSLSLVHSKKNFLQQFWNWRAADAILYMLICHTISLLLIILNQNRPIL